MSHLSGFFAHRAHTEGNKEHCLFFYFPSTHPSEPLARGWQSPWHAGLIPRFQMESVSKTPLILAFHSNLYNNPLHPHQSVHMSNSLLPLLTLTLDFQVLIRTGFLLHPLFYGDYVYATQPPCSTGMRER